MSVEFTAGEGASHCVADTLSGGGLFLSQVSGLEPGMQISLRFRPAKHLPVIEARANVLYIVAEQGAAVEFIDISPSDRQKLLRLILRKSGDRRLQRRAPLATQVECDRCMSLAFSRDISLAGMFIETSSPLPIGSPLTVRFNLDNNDRIVTASAQVTYVIDDMGMGILFTELDEEATNSIRDYIESLPALSKTQSAATETDA